MEDYLIDRETLEKFVDELFQRKPVPAEKAEEIKKEAIKSLDDKINNAMLSCLDDEQLDRLEQMLDRGEESPEAYEGFYKSAGVNLETVISNAMQEFGAEYLGGNNE